MEPQNETEIEMRRMFEENFELIRLESGHSITDFIKEEAWKQVVLYYRKLNHIAEKVTETEHKLSLPLHKTSKGRHFTIEGVVDILNQEGVTWMYDIKTHELEYILHNIELYEEQINIYAHIYQKLKKLRLDHVGIISTNLPDYVTYALRSRNEAQIKKALDTWQPVVEIKYDDANIQATIDNFAEVVDAIEDKSFESPGLEYLKTRVESRSGQLFASRVCRNCDARFSCPSYRKYLMENQNTYDKSKIKKYLLDLPVDNEEQEEWVNSNLETSIGRITSNE